MVTAVLFATTTAHFWNILAMGKQTENKLQLVLSGINFIKTWPSEQNILMKNHPEVWKSVREINILVSIIKKLFLSIINFYIIPP